MILTVHNINEESKLYGLENGTGLPKILYVILAQFVLTTFPQVTVSPIWMKPAVKDSLENLLGSESMLNVQFNIKL